MRRIIRGALVGFLFTLTVGVWPAGANVSGVSITSPAQSQVLAGSYGSDGSPSGFVKQLSGRATTSCNSGFQSVTLKATGPSSYSKTFNVSPPNSNGTYNFNANWVIDLPFGRGRAIGKDAHGLLGQLIGGWQVNGIVTFQSGFPLTLSAAGLPPYAGSRPSRVLGVRVTTPGAIVDRIGGVSTPTRYMDPAAFRPARSFEFGDTPRLMPDLRGPGIRNLDFSLFKNFPIREQARVQLRAEAFNATNAVRFGNPGTALGTPGFGVIGGQANSPRQIQLAAKLIF